MKNNIVFLDVTQAYGYGFSAANTKVELIARGLSEQGDSCVIHNGVVGIQFIKEPSVINKPNIGRVVSLPLHGNQFVSWIKNIGRFIRGMKSFYHKNDVNTVVLAYNDYHIFLFYVIISKLLGYRISCISHEWVPVVDSVRWFRRPSTWLYAKTFGWFADSILPISEYIIKKVQHFKKPVYKLPILGDYDKEPEIRKDKAELYYAYCGAADYFRVIRVIIKALRRIKGQYGLEAKLILVLGGTDKGVRNVRSYIDDTEMRNNVIIKRNLSFGELCQIYNHAQALLIPLDPENEQDQARFSQKIAEYLSIGVPVISTNTGEIPYYFEDKKNIILAEYSDEGVAEAFMWISAHPKNAQQIGKNGFYLGKSEFNYRIHGANLHRFLLG